MMYVKVDGKTVRMQLPRALIVSAWLTLSGGLAHAGYTFIGIRSELAACKQELRDMKQKIANVLPELYPETPGPLPSGGSGAPRP